MLKAGTIREEFAGIRDIIEGLLDEEPCAGISLLNHAEDMLVRFLEQAKELSDSMKDYYIRDAWDISASTINSSQT